MPTARKLSIYTHVSGIKCVSKYDKVISKNVFGFNTTMFFRSIHIYIKILHYDDSLWHFLLPFDVLV